MKKNSKSSKNNRSLFPLKDSKYSVPVWPLRNCPDVYVEIIGWAELLKNCAADFWEITSIDDNEESNFKNGVTVGYYDVFIATNSCDTLLLFEDRIYSSIEVKAKEIAELIENGEMSFYTKARGIAMESIIFLLNNDEFRQTYEKLTKVDDLWVKSEELFNDRVKVASAILRKNSTNTVVKDESKNGSTKNIFEPNSISFSNISLWNIDNLDVRENLVSLGQARYIDLMGNINLIAFSAFDYLWVNKPNLKRIDAGHVSFGNLVPTFKSVISYENRSNKEIFVITDMAYNAFNNCMYFLDIHNKKVWELQVESTLRDSVPLHLSELNSFTITSDFFLSSESRMDIFTSTETVFQSAIICSSYTNKILLKPLKADVEEKFLFIESDLLIADPGQFHPYSIAVDSKKCSILLACSTNNIILEYELATNRTTLLAGTKNAGTNGDGQSPEVAEFNHPLDIAIFRNGDILDPRMLFPYSAERLQKAQQKKQERLVLVADHLNHKIRKIIELDSFHMVLSLVGDGSGEKLINSKMLNIEDNNLLKIKTPNPTKIAISQTGRVAILCDKESKLLILVPAVNQFIHNVNSSVIEESRS